MEQDHLISISEASKILGVSEAALRQWTDGGKIKAFITPGGHRRYSETELKRFVTTHQKTLGIKDLVAEIEGTAELYREIFRASVAATSRYELTEESRERLAHLGRHLLNTVVRYITEPGKRKETLNIARESGQSFGEVLARLGFTLTDSVEAFILHRDPIISATTHLLSKREALSGKVVEMLPPVLHVMDEALVSLVNAYQKYNGQGLAGGMQK